MIELTIDGKKALVNIANIEHIKEIGEAGDEKTMIQFNRNLIVVSETLEEIKTLINNLNATI